MSIAVDLAEYVSLWDVTGDLQTYATAIGGMFAEVESYAEDLDGTPANTPIGFLPTALMDGPIAYWRFDEALGTTAVDLMAGRFNGTYNGGFTLGEASALSGDADKAVLLNGTTGYVSVPFNAALNPSTFTLEIWFVPTAITGTQSLFSAHASSKGFDVQTSAATVVANLDDGATSHTVGPTGNRLVAGQPAHIVLTYDGALAKLYVNGVFLQELSLSTFAPNVSAALRMGQDSSGGNFAGGTLDEAVLYGHALTATQVANHYAQAANAPGVSLAPVGAQIGWQPIWDPKTATHNALPWLTMMAGEVPPAGATDAQLRALIEAQPNQYRGTPQAIANAIKQVLTGAQTVGMRERWRSDTLAVDDDALSIYTFASQTPSQTAVQAAMRRTVPADIDIYYTVITESTWAAFTGGTWATVESTYTNWGNVLGAAVAPAGYTIY